MEEKAAAGVPSRGPGEISFSPVMCSKDEMRVFSCSFADPTKLQGMIVLAGAADREVHVVSKTFSQDMAQIIIFEAPCQSHDMFLSRCVCALVRTWTGKGHQERNIDPAGPTTGPESRISLFSPLTHPVRAHAPRKTVARDCNILEPGSGTINVSPDFIHSFSTRQGETAHSTVGHYPSPG